MPGRRSSLARRRGVFAEPKNKREALIKAESDAECARFHESPSQDDALIAEANAFVMRGDPVAAKSQIPRRDKGKVAQTLKELFPHVQIGI
jgi:hypothetical protein